MHADTMLRLSLWKVSLDHPIDNTVPFYRSNRNIGKCSPWFQLHMSRDENSCLDRRFVVGSSPYFLSERWFGSWIVRHQKHRSVDAMWPNNCTSLLNYTHNFTHVNAHTGELFEIHCNVEVDISIDISKKGRRSWIVETTETKNHLRGWVFRLLAFVTWTWTTVRTAWHTRTET